MKFCEKLKEIRKNKKITQEDFAQKLNVNPKTISFWESGKNIPSDENLTDICNVLNIEIKVFSECDDINENDNFNIPVRGELSASLGFGQEVFNEAPTSYFKMPKSLMYEIGASAKNSAIINTDGDSMYPTIIGGKDKILIDTSKKEIFDGKIYLIRIENSLYAKRLQKMPKNKLKVISDNPAYDSYTIDFNDKSLDFAVIGRVMWLCRNL